MKKKIVYLAALAAFCALAGCSGNSAMTGESKVIEERESENSSSSSDNNAATDFVEVTSEITELESGLSIVRYDGDYGLDRFLEQGGATSDGEVVQFLMNMLLSENADLQMGSAAFGCSTISVPNKEGGCFFGRNFDWQECDALIVLDYPRNGYSSVSTVNLNFIRQGTGFSSNYLDDDILTVAALYAPLDGMNEKGLCVSVNMIQDSATIWQDTEKTDITTTTAIRLLLDQASDVGEALELLAQYDLHASMDYMVHFAIADSNGRSVAVEYVDNEMVVIETPILTNFYMAEGKKYGIGTQQSHTRYEILEKVLEENPQMMLSQVRDTLDSVSKDNFGEFESTEWSVIFDQTALTATYYHRENYQNGYALQLTDDR